MEKSALIIFTVVGLGSLAFGVISIPFTISFIISSAVTEGRIVGENRKAEMEGGFSYAPIVRFVTKDGRSITSSSNIYGSRHRIGESVTVRYDPADPENAKIDSFSQLWGWSYIPLILGGMFIFFPRRFNRDRNENPAE